MSKYHANYIVIHTRDWFPKFANMLHSMLRQDLIIVNKKSEIREIIFLKMLKILFFKFLKTLFFWFFTFSSAPASACCIAYSQILGIRLYFELLLVLSSLQNSDFQSQIFVSKIIWIFLDCIFNEQYHFRSPCFIIDIFWRLQSFIIKNFPIFFSSM